MKDEQKTRELAERVCHQEEYGKQDVALAIQEAREKIEEVQGEGLKHTVPI